MALRHLLWVGDECHPEFSPAIDWLRVHAELTVVGSVREAVAAFPQRGSERWPVEPDAIVMAQIRPGQFAAAEIEQLHRRFPLARLAAILGSWCEGETRTGRPWPGVQRLYWHQWEPRFAREILGDVAESSSLCQLPRTVADGELVPRRRTAASVGPRRVAIQSYDVLSQGILSEALLAYGYSAVCMPPDAGDAVDCVAAAVWEPRVSSDAEFEELRQLALRVSPAPVVCILSFPRLEDCSRETENAHHWRGRHS